MKPLHAAAVLSLAVHALAVSPVGIDALFRWAKPDVPVIDLSLVASPSAETAPVRLSKTALAATPRPLAYPEFKKPAKIPTVSEAKAANRAAASPAPVLTAEPRAASPAVMAEARRAVPAKAADPAPRPSAPVVAKASDLLAEPKKARIFVGYFGGIREKINDLVRRRYSRENAGEGTVTLYFVLRSDGRLERAGVLDRQSDCPASVKEFAVKCLRDAAPFDPFPAGLEADRIAFNLTVLFQDL
ncbi:MAG TPA: hypothetical protein VL404_01085 [Candidatus Eisenbacteria bacterium]|nr:hypothetical protein [Candidatus Eisenbacteria bacterium]